MRVLVSEAIERFERFAAEWPELISSTSTARSVVVEPLEQPLGIDGDQHAVALLLEQLAKHVLHLLVGLDDHQLARLAVVVVAFEQLGVFVGGGVVLGFGDALDGELQVGEHFAGRLVAPRGVEFDRLGHDARQAAAASSGQTSRIGLMS